MSPAMPQKQKNENFSNATNESSMLSAIWSIYIYVCVCGKWAPTQMTADHDRHKCLISIRCDMCDCFYYFLPLLFLLIFFAFMISSLYFAVVHSPQSYTQHTPTIILHRVYVSNNDWNKKIYYGDDISMHILTLFFR